MKTLTLIIATAALMVAGASTADAKNTLQCSISATHSSGVSTANPSSTGYRVQRNLMYFGTWHPALTRTSCKTLQSAKASAARAANVSQVSRNSL
jgi:hypothetical protein